MGKPALDVTGHRFGRLTVVRRHGSDSSGRALWCCLCDCGIEKIVSGQNLRSDTVKSCGCFRRDQNSAQWKREVLTLPNDLGVKRRSLRNYKFGAQARRLNFDLSDTEFLALVKSPCHYCGEIKRINGVDRIDSNLGYSTANCVPCCPQCNRAKSSYSLIDFKAWIMKVYNHMEKNRHESYFGY